MNIRKLFTRAVENWPAKVLSIALAFVLFIFHRMNTLETRFFSVPLSVETSSTLIPASDYPRLIRVSLRGDAGSIYTIAESDIEAYIDLTRYETEGSYRTPVQIRRKGNALGVEPLEIAVEPLEISLQLDQKLSKAVSLSANLRGRVQSGYDLVSYSYFPTQVAVDGPLNILDALQELETDLVDLEGRSEDFNVIVNIINPNPLIIMRGSGMAEFRGVIRPSTPATAPARIIESIPPDQEEEQ